jgi:hypothetical protein
VSVAFLDSVQLLDGGLDMAKKANNKPKVTIGAKAAMAARDKQADNDGPKTKAGFGKRSMAAGAARTASASSKPPRSKSPAKARGKSMIGKAVGAVASTVSSVADSATALFKRNTPKTH